MEYKKTVDIVVMKAISKYATFSEVLEVKWDRGDTEAVGKCTVFCGNINKEHKLYCFIIHKKIILAVQRLEIVSGRMPCIIQRGHCCDILMKHENCNLLANPTTL
jgi:hypothetical protein